MDQPENRSDFYIDCVDGAEGMLSLPDRSIKLVYGSPPYPNALREYGIWSSGEYLQKISPFLDASMTKLRDDGFIVLNVKANRERQTSKVSSKRSLVVEKLAIEMEETWGLHCVDIEIWVKANPVPTGLRVACQDAYEQNLWFSKSPKWTINLDAIRREYDPRSIETYGNYEYKPRTSGNTYVRKNKKISPNPLGALPKNVILGGVSTRISGHPASQPLYLPEKYIKAVTDEGDLVVDPWMGSGTTGLAALSLKRRFAGFDCEEKYVAIARERLESFIRGGKSDEEVDRKLHEGEPE